MGDDIFRTKTKTSTSTNQMYPKLEEGWNKALDAASNVYTKAKLPKQAPLNNDITTSFDQTRALAAQGVPNLDALYGVQSNMLANGGMTQGMQDASGILGGYAANNGVTPEIAKAAGYLDNFANGSYTEDPRLQAQLDINANRAANAGATRFGGGRYGSAAIGSGIGNAVAEANNGVMLQSNENARNRQLQASGMMGDLYQGAANRGASAAGAMGQLATAGAQNQATWGSMTPMLNEARYDGASRLAGIGDFLQNRTQDRIDQKANFPKENLNWYAGILSGMGNQGSTTINKTPGASAAQSILGGAAMGAGIGSKIPGLGAGWGAGIGGILSFL